MKTSKAIAVIVGLLSLYSTYPLLHWHTASSVCDRLTESLEQKNRTLPVRCEGELFPFGSRLMVVGENDIFPNDVEKLELTAFEKWFFLPLQVYIDDGKGFVGWPLFIITEKYGRLVRDAPIT